MKILTVRVKSGQGRAQDLVFQSVRDGKPIRDNNILTRFIRPAARKLGLGWVNWRGLRPHTRSG